MNRRAFATMLACAGVALVPGSTLAHTPPGPVEKALLRIEADLLGALIRNDVAAFERRLGDNFVFIAPDGALQDRAAWLNDLKSGALKMTSSANDEFKVRIYGNTAIVTYLSTEKGTYKGEDISGQFRWTDVFVKKGDRWLMVSSQGTPIARK